MKTIKLMVLGVLGIVAQQIDAHVLTFKNNTPYGSVIKTSYAACTTELTNNVGRGGTQNIQGPGICCFASAVVTVAGFGSVIFNADQYDTGPSMMCPNSYLELSEVIEKDGRMRRLKLVSPGNSTPSYSNWIFPAQGS